MIIGGTVNLGGYAKRKYESSEYTNAADCIDDIRVSLLLVREPRVDAYLRRVFVDDDGDRKR